MSLSPPDGLRAEPCPYAVDGQRQTPGPCRGNQDGGGVAVGMLIEEIQLPIRGCKSLNPHGENPQPDTAPETPGKE